MPHPHVFQHYFSFMMSTFHNGLLRTMKANYTVTEGDLRVIRPLVYIREKALRDFAETQKLPIIPENCPACFEQPKVSLSQDKHVRYQFFESHYLIWNQGSVLYTTKWPVWILLFSCCGVALPKAKKSNSSFFHVTLQWYKCVYYIYLIEPY